MVFDWSEALDDSHTDAMLLVWDWVLLVSSRLFKQGLRLPCRSCVWRLVVLVARVMAGWVFIWAWLLLFYFSSLFLSLDYINTFSFEYLSGVSWLMMLVDFLSNTTRYSCILYISSSSLSDSQSYGSARSNKYISSSLFAFSILEL